jgi:hypothetical protein
MSNLYCHPGRAGGSLADASCSCYRFKRAATAGCLKRISCCFQATAFLLLVRYRRMRPAGRKPWLQSAPHSVAFNKSARDPLWLNPSFSIEPQAHPIWQNSRFEQGADPFSTVIYPTRRRLHGTAGASRTEPRYRTYHVQHHGTRCSLGEDVLGGRRRPSYIRNVDEELKTVKGVFGARLTW